MSRDRNLPPKRADTGDANTTPVDMNNLRILLMHGLETKRDGGHKAHCLREAFGASSLLVPDMQIRNFVDAKQSKYMQMLIGFFAVYGAGALFVVVRLARALLAKKKWVPHALKLAGLAVGARVIYKKFKQMLVRQMLWHSKQVQRQAIARFNPHVVVASSWGGCVAVECLHDGIYQKPTVLLAPAHGKVTRISNSNGRRSRHEVSVSVCVRVCV